MKYDILSISENCQQGTLSLLSAETVTWKQKRDPSAWEPDLMKRTGLLGMGSSGHIWDSLPHYLGDHPNSEIEGEELTQNP